MIKTRAWPVRAMYMLVAFALVISLMISAAPSQSVTAAPGSLISRWDRVTTPSWENWVLAPDANIVDYAVGDEGRVAYAILDGWDLKADEYDVFLLKSTDHAATWRNITEGLKKEITRRAITVDYDCWWIERVAVAPDDPDFMAVALWAGTACDVLYVFISKDGGTTFRDTGTVELDWVYDFAISPAGDDGWRDMAIGGIGPNGHLWRSRAREDSATGWVNATTYLGWAPSQAVGAIAFAPSWNKDRTILVVTGNYTTFPNMVHLQSGTWGTDVVEKWNKEAGFADPVVILDGSDGSFINTLMFETGRWTAGIALPSDYEGRYSTKRFAWVWVNYHDPDGKAIGEIYVVDDGYAQAVREQVRNRPWLANVSYWGTIASGKAIAGVLGSGTWDWEDWTKVLTGPCAGVQVYHYDTVGPNMDICCPAWKPACKPPTGTFAMEAFYVKEDKAYAVALGIIPVEEEVPGGFLSPYWDESAWSFSFDDGYTWNQLSLIDTWISYLSDVAVSPNCNKTMAVSANYGPKWEGWWEDQNGEGDEFCDSVWYMAVEQSHAPEYSGKWMRTWCGKLEGREHPFGHAKWGLLRLAPEEINGETVYLVDVGTSKVYYNDMQTLACWEPGTSSITEIIDLAVKNESTIYALGLDGFVAMSDDYGAAPSWSKPVDTEIDDGWTIAVWDDHVIVGGQHSNWNYSADGGETWDPDELDLAENVGDSFVTVVFDSYYDANNVVYAALGFGDDNGVYRWIIGEDEEWTDLGADPYDYTGLVVDNADGNPMTSPTNGAVLYASYIDETFVRGTYTGVARTLTPGEDFCCDEADWDYLIVSRYPTIFEDSWFVMGPRALKICGCLEPGSNTKLFAIGFYAPESERDYWTYDMEEAKWGTVWMFEDCYSKWGPDLNRPADGEIIPADPCDCTNLPFTMAWDRMCDACNYQIQFALDPSFNELVAIGGWVPPVPSSGIAGGWEVRPVPATNPSVYVDGWFTPGMTYYWRVRSVMAETGQVIRSWWSPERSFTVALFGGTGVTLVSPEPGSTHVARTNIAFTWTSLAEVDSYNFVLSPNADLSGSVAQQTGLTNHGYTFTGTLSPDTSYYWRVTGIKNGAATTEAVGTFRTSAAEVFCSPQSGLCFNTEAELREHHDQLHRDAMRTPAWVWVIIAIGAVLVIVVIVLIFRTRRV